MILSDEQRDVLDQLYFLLRDQGFSIQSEAIKRLIYCIEIEDIKRFNKEFKSTMIWGGAGSIKDISLKESGKQAILDDYLERLKKIADDFK